MTDNMTDEEKAAAAAKKEQDAADKKELGKAAKAEYRIVGNVVQGGRSYKAGDEKALAEIMDNTARRRLLQAGAIELVTEEDEDEAKPARRSAAKSTRTRR